MDITFSNRFKTTDITVKKVVDPASEEDSFAFTATLLVGKNPVKSYKVFDASDDADDLITDDNGRVAFNLAHDEARTIAVPVGTRLVLQEESAFTAAAGDNTQIVNLDKYATSAEAVRTENQENYTDQTAYSEADRSFTLNAIPSTPLTVTYTNILRQPLTVTVKDVTKTYNGEDQNGNMLTSVIGTGSAVDTDEYTVTGLKSGDVLAVTGYARATGRNAGTYDGSFAGATLVVTRNGVDVTREYILPGEDSDDPVAGRLTIEPRTVTVAAIDADKLYGEDDPEWWIVEIDGLLEADEGGTLTHAAGVDDAVDYTYSIGSGDDKVELLRFAVAREMDEDAGSYAITPTGEAVQGNYAVTFVSGVFTIRPQVTVSVQLEDCLAPEGGVSFAFRDSYTLNEEETTGNFTIQAKNGDTAASDPLPVPTGAVLTVEAQSASVNDSAGFDLEYYDLVIKVNGTIVEPEAAGRAVAEVDVNVLDILYIYTRRTAVLTVRKTVISDETSGTFDFNLTLEIDGRPIRNYNPYGTAATNDDGAVAFQLNHNAQQQLTLPVGGEVTLAELLSDTQSREIAVFMIQTHPHGGENLLSGVSDSYKLTMPAEAATIRVVNIPSICKVTDGDGSLLYREDGEGEDLIHIPAIYGTIHAAFEDINNSRLFTKSDSGYESYTQIPYQIQMLTDYEVPHTDAVVVNAGHQLTFTTASISATDGYPFRGGAEASRATLTRESDNTKAFITVEEESGRSTTFTMSSLVIDGANAKLDEGIKGGALYANNSVVTVDNCRIVNFEADDGGAIYASGDSLTVKDSFFEHCVSNKAGNGNGGGAIQTESIALELRGTDFKDCVAQFQGGAVYHKHVNSASLLISDCRFTDCHARAGGGLETYAPDVTVENSTFTRCYAMKMGTENGTNGGALNIFSNNDPSSAAYSSASFTNCVFKGCTAVQNGGGLRSAALINTVTDCRFVVDEESGTATGNSAGNGGGMAFSNASAGSMAALSGTIVVSGNSANKGGGVYTASNITLLDSVSVTGNKLNNNTALNAAGLYIENDKQLVLGSSTGESVKAYVTGNTTSNGTASNTRLSESEGRNSENSVSVNGMIDQACDIRVVNAKQLLTQFGSTTDGYAGQEVLKYHDDFGANPPVFLSDDGVLRGIIDPDDPSGKRLIWYGEIVCKITDADGNLLYYSGGAPAIFASLANAIDTFGDKSCKFSTTVDGEGVDNLALQSQIQMLVQEYEMDRNFIGDLNNSYEKNINQLTLTTASKDATQYPYRGESGTTCTIRRTASTDMSRNNFQVMFRVREGQTLTFRNITLDGGRKEGVKAKGDGAIVKANTKSTLILQDGAVLQNAETNANGGAVTVQDGATLRITGNVTIRNCAAKNGGAINIDRNHSSGAVTTVYIEDSALGSPAFYGNTATNNGAAIRVSSAVNRLYIEGSPIFTGTDETGNAICNTVTRSGYSGKANGGDTQAYADNKVRQDICLEGTGSPMGSLIVSGPLTCEQGSIWVWAVSDPHYREDGQFAVIDQDDSGDYVISEEGATCLAAFRNAQDDVATSGNVRTVPLFGKLKKDANEDGTEGDWVVVWGDISAGDIVFLKVDSFGKPLNGAAFMLYTNEACTTAAVEADAESKQVTDEDGNTSEGIVTFEKVPDGIYYMKEKKLDGASGAPEGYAENTDTYIVLVGAAALTVPSPATGLWASGEALAKITQSDIDAQTDQGEDEEPLRYAIFKLETDSATTRLAAVTTPDIATYGIVNVSETTRKVMLRKVDTDSGLPLQGAEFELLNFNLSRYDFGVDGTGADATARYMQASDSEGVFFIGRLPLGTYYLKETTAPAGYTLPAEGLYYRLKVPETGDVELSIVPEAPAAPEDPTPTAGPGGA